MNTKRILWSIGLGWLLPCLAHAPVESAAGWHNAGGESSALPPVEMVPDSTHSLQINSLLSGISGDSIAEAITPDIQARARGLEHDPQRIFDYVHERIRYVHYFGSKKGAQLTLLEGSGNEFDQCALLVALLRSAGYTNTTYQFGGQKVPYASADHRDFQHWLGLWKPNTNWNEALTFANFISRARGYPGVYDFQDSTNLAIHRLWVKLPLNGIHYLLDPAFRVSEPSFGYYVDVYLQFSGSVSAHGTTAADSARSQRAFDLATYFQSAMEHGVIEQLQSSNLVAASTVKLLQRANTHGTALDLVRANHWSAVSGSLVHYDLNDLLGKVNEGRRLLLPQNGQIQIAGAGSWKGCGIVDKLDIPGTNSMGLLISGGYQGGYSAFPYSVPSPSCVSSWSYAAPTYFNPPPLSQPPSRAADPVNMVDGSFIVSENDLTLGPAEPRGLNFARDYSSRRRFHKLTGLGAGWTHNYFMNRAEVSAPQPALGETTPAPMAAMRVATRAAFEFYTTTNSVKPWAVTALITKWGVDQLRSNSVSITLGNEAGQFIKQPDGPWTPPAGSTMTLLKTNAVYWLQERHGRTFKFEATGRLTNLVDQYNQPLNVSYLATTSRLPQTVTDWKGRSLTFTYSGTPQRLASVADSTGRSVSYGYTANGGRLDLTAVTDPENKTHTFLYDTNHQILAVTNAANRLVTTNIYDGFGRVVTQYTEGDLNKMWRLYWAGAVNVEQDPAGGKRRYFYDDKHRHVAMEDALGNVARMFYDGQDHTLMTVSPLNETNRSEYDGAHNLLRSMDPLGFTNRFYYDAQHRLTRSEDARGNTNRFGYNAQHSLTGSTNGAGDWATAIYNADGTTLSRSDAGGTTSYGYDAFGQVNLTTYPGSLGSEGFLNHARGDMLSHTNARGFATRFQYNQRRQLTNTIAPTNVTERIVHDAVGNAPSMTDARGFTSSNTWSATQKLLATTLPATPQGTPVATNVYDARAWLLRAISPLLAAISYTNDAAQRLVSVTDPLNRTTKFGDDADGRRLTATNAANEVTRQFWNARGELTKVVDGASNTVLRAYDPAGNQITLTNRNGKKWQFQFDAAHRLTNTITPLNRQTAVTYDARGLVSTVREPSLQTTTNFYDAKGRLTNITDAVGVRWLTYDANDNLTGVTNVGQASRLSQTFDAYDRMTSHTTAEGQVLQYRYDANGNLTNLIYPGNRVVAYAYDSLNRLTNVTDWANRKTSIEYDLASQVKKITRPNGTVRTIDYDVAGQTTNIWERLTNGLPIAMFKLNYNAAARVDWEFAAPLPHAYTPPSRSMTFDDDNRLATFNGNGVANDADGNLTRGPLTNSTFATYTYDARNRLVGTLSTASLTYGYDPAGNRVAITNGASITRLVVNPNAALSQVLMRVRSGVTNYYVYGLGLLYEITETATTTNTLTYHYDYRGSTIALTDGSGNVTDRSEYSPYATTTYRSGTNDTPFLYNGRYGVQTDANGLLYMRARFYNPYLCRFLNADPSGFSGGLNFYAYADGNPVSLMDPFGLGAGEVGGRSWLNTAWNVTQGVGLMGAGFVPWLADAIGAYTVVAPDSSALDRTLSGVSLGVNAWTLGAAPNLGPIKRGAQMIGDAFGGGAKTAPGVKYIGKMDDLQGIPRRQTLLDDLPDLGSTRANYYQNSSVLRKALRDGYEIRDASAYRPNWSPDPTLLRPDQTVGQSFLGAERLILDNKGLKLSPNGAYVP